MLSDLLKEIANSAVDRLLPWTHHLRTVGGVAFSADGSLAATGGFDGCVKLTEVSTQRRIWRFRDRSCYFRCVSFIENSRALCCISHTGKVYLFETYSGRVLKQFSTGKTIIAAKVLFNGMHALLGVFNDVVLWDLGSNRELRRFPGHEGDVCVIELTAKQDHFVSAEVVSRSISYWSMDGDAPLRRISLERSVFSAAIAPNGEWFAIVDGIGGAVHKWSLPDCTDLGALKDVKDNAFRLAASPDGKYLAVAYHEGGIGLVDVMTGNESYRADAPGGSAGAMEFSPDGKCVLAGTVDGEVALVKMIY